MCARRMRPAAGFAVVTRVVDRATGEPYAVKIMSLPPVGFEPGDNESTRWVHRAAKWPGAGCRPFGSHAEVFTRLAAPLPGSAPRPFSRPPLLREDIFKEIDILCGLDHENVVALKEYFEEGNKVGRPGSQAT